ncbi:MAG: hypothetical protein RL564_2111 [Pseudomonadota bacterium]|jgi:hypothetical protein
MQAEFSGTLLIDFVIVATLVEWAVLTLLWRRKKQGLPPSSLSWMFLPGLCLMLSVRSAVLGLPWYTVMLLLLASGLTHLIDLGRRWIR